MKQLASTIKDQLDLLTGEYERQLRTISGYGGLSDRVRLDIARSGLERIVAALEVGDDAGFVQFIQARAREELEGGFEIESVLQALTALEGVLVPLVTRVGAGKFLWLAFAHARTAISEQVTGMLDASGSKFRQIVDRLPVGVFCTTPDGRITEANPAFLRVVGYDSLKAINQVGVSSLYQDPADRDRLLELLRQGPVRGFETRFRRADGQVVAVSINVRLVREKGRPQFLEGIVEDITGRKRVEEELIRLQRAVEQIADGVAVADLDGNIQFVNPAWAQMHGYSPEEVQGKSLSIFHTKEQLQEEVIPFNQRVVEAGVHQDEVGHVRKDGTCFPTRMTTVLLRDELGNPVGFVGTASDITERKQLERQIQESLERRGRQVQTSTEVAQEIAGASVLDELFRRVVMLIKERFDYYYAQIFRYDPDRNAVMLVVGYGEVGDKMLADGHRLEVGRGVVGKAVATGQPVLATDVTQDSEWVPHSYLPETKGELAVPIKWGDEVLGILDVQSDVAGALTEEDQLLLEGLCGQIAIAMESTRLLEEANVFRRFADASGQGLGMADLEGCITYANPALCRMLDVASPEDLVGRSLVTYYPAELRHRVQNEILPAVMRDGQWMGELALLSSKGKIRPTLENFIVIRDKGGEPRYLADVVADITERKRTEAEMAERLQELNTLSRAVSREGWTVSRETTELAGGYLFDQMTVRPADGLWMPEVGLAVEQGTFVSPTRYESESDACEETAAVSPLSVHGEIVGTLGVYDDPGHPLSPEDLVLLQAVSEQVALALDGARLFEQTQAALGEAESLYAGSDRVVRAATLDEVLQALIGSTALQRLDRVSIALFNRPWEGEMPEEAIVVAMWERDGRVSRAPVGTRYFLTQFPVIDLVTRHEPALFRDIATDERVDETLRALLVNRLGMQSLLLCPLVAGGQWIGFVNGQASTAMELKESEIRQIDSLTDQASAVIQGLRLLEQTQARARREQILRQVAARVGSAADVDTVMRTAAQEIGRVMGREAFIYVGDDEQLTVPQVSEEV